MHWCIQQISSHYLTFQTKQVQEPKKKGGGGKGEKRGKKGGKKGGEKGGGGQKICHFFGVVETVSKD